MPTADGCRVRRERLLTLLRPKGPLLLADPLNLRYFANCYVDPYALGADFGGLLLLRPDGSSTLFHDNRLPRSVDQSFVDERIPVKWYDGKSPGQGPRRLALREVVELSWTDGRIHDAVTDPMAEELWRAVSELRRAKDADEVATFAECCRAAEAGHAWALANIEPWMTELDVYLGVSRECQLVAGKPVIVYGDFIVCDGPNRRVGMPTDRVLKTCELFILDFSVVIQGYRCDFTNTLAVGRNPRPEQQRLFDLSVQAMAAGESQLRAGVPCLDVYQAIQQTFREAGMAERFPHHAGHGLGLSHPEPPYIVERASEVLAAGDIVTLEPGLYQDGIGGVRIEHNYLITETGFERLSQHRISLT